MDRQQEPEEKKNTVRPAEKQPGKTAVRPAEKQPGKTAVVRREVTQRKIVTRSRVALAVLFLLLCALCARFAFLQLWDPYHYADAAADQYTYEVKLEAKRGAIYASDGVTKLAVSATTQTVFISPKDVLSEATEPADGSAPMGENVYIRMLAEGLADCLDGMEAQTIIDKYNNLGERKSKLRYLIVKKDIGEEEEAKVRAFILENKLEKQVALEEGSKRYYPYGSFAAQLLGFVGSDNVGLTGIESAYDEYLRGTDGRAVRAQDANGNELAYNYEMYVPAEDGWNVVTTIDASIQNTVEKYIREAYEEHEPEGRVSCIVMDVETGEILAMAIYPAFDLNSYATLSPEYQSMLDRYEGEDRDEYRTTLMNEMWNNTIVTRTYEPGSTFKIVTAAAALETGSITPEQTFNCGLSIKVAGKTIHCWSHHDHGRQNLKDALINSCNPAFVQIGMAVGAEDFIRYFEDFGYSRKTGTDIPGEVTSIYFKTTGENFGDVSLAAYSFGQTFKITMMQHIVGLSAVANGGYLVTPHVVKQITDANGSVIKTFPSDPVRQVVAGSVCEIIRNDLVNSTKNACVSGYNVISKTGTSENRETKREDDYVSSCVTFAPAEDPKIAVLVTVDTPKVSKGYYGSSVAAPAVGRILTEVLPYLGIEPGESGRAETVTVADYRGSKAEEAKTAIEGAGMTCVVQGEGDVVIRQMPAAGTVMAAKGTVILYTAEDAEEKTVKVPDLLNSSPEAARQALAARGLNVRFTGLFGNDTTGCTVNAMSIQPGETVPAGTVIELECRYQSLND